MKNKARISPPASAPVSPPGSTPGSAPALHRLDRDATLAALAHEVRGPLSAILVALELLEDHAVDHDLARIATIRRQVEHVALIVDGVLDMFRAASGCAQLTLQSLELADVVERAIEMVRPLAIRRGHRLINHVPPHGLPIVADLTRLVQVVWNLLSNAVKYTPDQGAIVLEASRDPDAVSFVVSDSGIGISPDILPRVFELFTQADEARPRCLGGLGLGLGIVHALVSLHGGTVSAASAGPGRGSQFTVRLPSPPTGP